MGSAEISILQGDTFVVSDLVGDLDGVDERPHGLYYRDMRHLSRWQVRLNGHPLEPLEAHTPEYDAADFVLREPEGTVFAGSPLSVIRRRQVAAGMIEQLTVQNHGAEPVQFELTVLYEADFADLFEIKEGIPKKPSPRAGDRYRSHNDNRLTLGYRRGDFCRETIIEANGAQVSEDSITFRGELAPAQEWCGSIDVHISTQPGRPATHRIHRPDMPGTLDEWLAGAPRLDTDWDDLRQTYRRSLVDLAALRFYPEALPGTSLPAAGLPWFMAVFGRDSLLTSYQTLPFTPELAQTTLRALALRQAEAWDDFRDAEPGKILHELRQGELVYFGEHPHSPYYGAADSTPLFLILLDEYERWTGDRQLVRTLEPQARLALRWLDWYGDLDGDGYVEYQTRNPGAGLDNQCWKDSWNSIVHPDGRPASRPHAVCEIQGYAYDARRRAARLAREVWQDDELADRLERDAAALRARFDNDFWLPEHGWYALALDGQKRPVPTLTSNIGHLLWSGIVPPERLDALVGNICGGRMFSGWGVRTMAEGQPAYDPIEYHNGTVWPHDTALIAAGLARYGRREEATRLAVALLEASGVLGYRLPEAFAGYAREVTRAPVPYPTACSPQAWASGAPLLLLRVLLGMEPGEDGLSVAPALPGGVRHIRLSGVYHRGDRVDATTTALVRATAQVPR